MGWRRRVSSPASSRRWRCGRWPSPSSAAGPSATWRRGGWSSSPAAPAAPTSPLTPRGGCGPPRGGAGALPWPPPPPPDAVRFRPLDYMELLNRNLKVMDATAVALCKDNNLDIVVFDITQPGNLKRAVLGEQIGTLVGGRQ